jgi:hypothetical protein
VIVPRRPSPIESPLLIELDDEPLKETLTAWGGVLLTVQVFRSLGVPFSTDHRQAGDQNGFARLVAGWTELQIG